MTHDDVTVIELRVAVFFLLDTFREMGSVYHIIERFVLMSMTRR